ncbi:MAG: hypothetical protein HFI72_04420 [Peptococcaceae bacterium]|jgi:uncharacterized repeat protein (TIGR02543 family)|nr:hypothetical protein [Peptococcaceae bacterium]
MIKHACCVLLGIVTGLILWAAPVFAIAEAQLAEPWTEEGQSVRYQAAADGPWIYTSALHIAYGNVYDGGTVQVSRDILAAGLSTIRKDVTITSFDPAHPCVYSVTVSPHPCLLNIGPGGSLTLQDIIIDGGGRDGVTAGMPLIRVAGGSLVLEQGAVLCNNNNVNPAGIDDVANPGGGGISVFNGGSVTMKEGAIIRDCSAYYGGGVSVLGDAANQFTLDGGVIEHCSAARGGGLYINNGSFILKNGEIRANKVQKRTGLDDVFDFNGQGGGMIIAGDSAVVTISGGTITENDAESAGGGIRCERGQLILSGGNITKNHTGTHGGGILTNPLFKGVQISGNVYINENTAVEGSPNFELDGNENDGDITPLFQVPAPFTANVLNGISRWVMPTAENPVRLIAYGVNGYEITKADLQQCLSDNEDYALILLPGGAAYDDKLVMAVTALEVEIAEASITLNLSGEGTSANLTAEVLHLPEEAIHKGLLWRSGDESIATVDANGVVTAVGEGSTTITATLLGNENIAAYTDICNVTVKKAGTSRPGGGAIGSSHDGAIRYELAYVTNCDIAYSSEHYAENKVVTIDKEPSREGYVFTGWYEDASLLKPIGNVKMTENKLVYAGWRVAVVPELLNGKDHFAYIIGYEDNTVRPLENISRAETAAIFFRLLTDDVRQVNLTKVNTFADVSADLWSNQAVSTMQKLGIIQGRSVGYFAPDAAITRAEFAAICARFDHSDAAEGKGFSDISDHWAEGEIKRAAALGWVKGYPDGTFRPAQPITRAEVMTTVNRMLCRLLEKQSDLWEGYVQWSDVPFDAWYYLAIAEATNSHNYENLNNGYERWTGLTAAPNWKDYQK